MKSYVESIYRALMGTELTESEALFLIGHILTRQRRWIHEVKKEEEIKNTKPKTKTKTKSLRKRPLK